MQRESRKRRPGKIRRWLSFLNNISLADPVNNLVFEWIRFVFLLIDVGIHLDKGIFLPYWKIAKSVEKKVFYSMIHRDFPVLSLAVRKFARHHPYQIENFKNAIIIVAGFLYDKYQEIQEESEIKRFYDFLKHASPGELDELDF